MPNGTTIKIYNTRATPYPDPSAGYNHLLSRRPDGSQYEFDCLGASCTAASDVPLKLVVLSAGYTLTDENNITEQYNLEGALTSVTFQDGYAQNMTYSNSQLVAMTDSFGRSLNFFYNANDKLIKVTTPDGNVLYGFDTQYSRLSTVTYPDTRIKKYQYFGSPHLYALTGIVDENNSLYATISYDAQGRAYQSGFAGNVLKS
ncbi:hypothetical protein CJD38_18165, partial [Stenotrophobium rhamnosiphilum]